MQRRAKTLGLAIALACSAAMSCATARAVDARPSDKVLVAKTFRVSKLTGLNVRNREGEKLGTVNDLVANVETGKIEYVAISVGGILGVGDKLFAVPFDLLKFDHGQDEMFFVLDMSKDKLMAAPGFNKSDWPDFADPHWSEKIDSYFRHAATAKQSTTTTTTTRTKETTK